MKILLTLGREGELFSSKIAATAAITNSAFAYAIAILKNSGFVSLRDQGKNCFYSLTDKGQKVYNALAAELGVGPTSAHEL